MGKQFTHYAKGTLLMLFKFSSQAAYKTTNFSIPSRYSTLSLNISYLALEEGSPLLIQTSLNPFYLIIFFCTILWF
jgi:hypothetical protein